MSKAFRAAPGDWFAADSRGRSIPKAHDRLQALRLTFQFTGPLQDVYPAVSEPTVYQ
jgi:hypothetical protein